MECIYNHNNSVYAVMSVEHYELLQTLGFDKMKALDAGVKWFTFLNPKVYGEKENDIIFYTGSWHHLEAALAGFAKRREGLYVPFSNQAEYGNFGDNEEYREYRFITTVEEFAEVFKIPKWEPTDKNVWDKSRDIDLEKKDLRELGDKKYLESLPEPEIKS